MLKVKTATCPRCQHKQKIVTPTKFGNYRCAGCKKTVPESR